MIVRQHPERVVTEHYHVIIAYAFRNPLEKAPKIEREPSKSSLTIGNNWRAIRDSNPGPLVPEPIVKDKAD